MCAVQTIDVPSNSLSRTISGSNCETNEISQNFLETLFLKKKRSGCGTLYFFHTERFKGSASFLTINRAPVWCLEKKLVRVKAETGK